MLLALASFSLLVGGTATPSSAEPDATYSVTGSTPLTATFKPDTIGLCTAACVIPVSPTEFNLRTEYQSAQLDDGIFAISNVPPGSYSLAVTYAAPNSRDVPVPQAGYLKRSTDATYVVVKDIADSTPIAVSQNMDIGTLVVNVPTPPPPKPLARGNVVLRSVGILGDSIFANYRGSGVTNKSVIRQSIRGCSGRIIARKKVPGFRGTKYWRIVIPYNKTPRMGKIRTIVSESGHADKILIHSFGPVPHSSC